MPELRCSAKTRTIAVIVLWLFSPPILAAEVFLAPLKLQDQLQVATPAEKGFDEKLLLQLKLRLDKPQSAAGFQQLHSLLLYKSGALVVEHYQKGNNDWIHFEQGVKLVKAQQDFVWTADTPHYVASVTKAVTATLTGIALKQTDLRLDTTLAQLLPEHPLVKADPIKAAINVHHLLSMQAGFVWDEWTSDDLVKLWQQPNFVDYLLQKPNTGPGKSWVYNSALPNLMLRLLQMQLKQPVQLWAKQQLFDKLGFTLYRWENQPDGIAEGSARLWLRPRDMLKLGILYLQQGQWQGEQLLPLGWVQQMTSRQVTSPSGEYGYYFWLRQQDGIAYYTAEGDGGQYIAVFPTLDMVLVLTQGNYLQWPLYKGQADSVIRLLIQSIKPTQMPN